jgi:hypothetical protein
MKRDTFIRKDSQGLFRSGSVYFLSVGDSFMFIFLIIFCYMIYIHAPFLRSMLGSQEKSKKIVFFYQQSSLEDTVTQFYR